MLGLNFIMLMIWIPLVLVPQIYYNQCGRDMTQDWLWVADKYGFGKLSLGTLVLTNISYVGEPSLLFIGGYRPFYNGTALPGTIAGTFLTDVTWNMDGCYLLSTVAVFVISVWWFVKALGMKSTAGEDAAHGSIDKHTYRIIESLFAGWDFGLRSPSLTHQQRTRMLTFMKEALADASRQDQDNVVLSQKEHRKRTAKRTFFVGILIAILIGGLYGVGQIVYNFEAITRATSALVPGVAITLATSLCPVFMKICVRQANFKPEFTLKLSVGSTLCFKMLSLAVIFYNLKLGTIEDAPGDRACKESDAGFEFFNLVVSDFLVAVIMQGVVKPLMASGCECGPFGKKQVFDLPSEIMKLIYRQSLLWVGARRSLDGNALRFVASQVETKEARQECTLREWAR